MIVRCLPLSMVIVFGMTVKLRIEELMKTKGIASAYQLAAAVGDRVGEATIYRIVRARGRVQNLRSSTLEALADVFDCEVADLFERKRGK